MFAHAWFQHRDVFWQLENQEGLYVFYKTVCDVYALIPEENYTVPAEAEGGAPEELPKGKAEGEKSNPPKIERQSSLVTEGTGKALPEGQGAEKTTLSTGATTRRHKHTPSTGSMVTTIQESDEDGDGPRGGLAPTFVSTVRRDPSSSPPKQPPPMPRIPDAEVKDEDEEEAAKEDEPSTDVTEKMNEMTIEEKSASEEETKDEPDADATPRIGSEPDSEEKLETKEENEPKAATDANPDEA